MIVYIKNIEFRYLEITKKEDKHPKKLGAKIYIDYEVSISYSNKVSGIKILDYRDDLDLVHIKEQILNELKKDLENDCL